MASFRAQAPPRSSSRRPRASSVSRPSSRRRFHRGVPTSEKRPPCTISRRDHHGDTASHEDHGGSANAQVDVTTGTVFSSAKTTARTIRSPARWSIRSTATRRGPARGRGSAVAVWPCSSADVKLRVDFGAGHAAPGHHHLSCASRRRRAAAHLSRIVLGFTRASGRTMTSWSASRPQPHSSPLAATRLRQAATWSGAFASSPPPHSSEKLVRCFSVPSRRRARACAELDQFPHGFDVSFHSVRGWRSAAASETAACMFPDFAFRSFCSRAA